MSDQQSNDEASLLSRLMQDDMEAFDTLYWQYQKAVYQNVLKLTRDTISTEDIVQEVFISLWEKRHTIDTQRSVAGWLFVSSYNRSINTLKKKLRESKAFKELGNIALTDSDAPLDISDTQLNLLENAIAALSPQKKKVFELCKLQGKTYEEAANELQISKHTVKEYLSEAIKSIKDFIQQHPGQGINLVILVKTLSFLLR